MMRILIVALLVAGCSNERRDPPRPPTARIDHVILGAADLDAAMAEVARTTGVTPVAGGSHPGRGTRNALLSLGDGTYLEILAPDPAQDADTQELRHLATLGRPTPIGWAVSADEERSLRSILSSANVAATPSDPGSREKPDGSELRWVTFGYADIKSLLAPFFIVWADRSKHPSLTSPGGCRLADVSIESPEAPAIAPAVAPLGLKVRVASGRQERMRVTLSCARGTAGF